MTSARDEVAAGLATAMLAGPWRRASMLARTRAALGSQRSPAWLLTLADAVLAAYREAPADRPRELAGFVRHAPAFAKAWEKRRRPRIVQHAPVPTSVVDRPWPVTLLPDRSALAQLLDLDQSELDWFADVRGLEATVSEPLRHYRWTTIAKRDGVRVVAAPKPRLKEIQRRLLRHVFEPIPVHDAAHGCVRGRSVATAVTPHTGRPVVVRLDLADFFGSVRAGRVWELLRTAGLPEAVAHTVTGLVTTVAPAPHRRTHPILRTPHLPVGAPTSPAVANLVTFSLDRRLSGLADRWDATYTRYVDDLVFSGGRDLDASRFTAQIAAIAANEGFRLNNAKTAARRTSGRQGVLGTVVNDHPTLPRPERDALRALLHNCAVHGWRSQARDHDDLRAHVLGRIAWVASLDPVLGARLRVGFDAVDWT